MAQQCDICGKKPQSGNRISHAHNVTKRRWNVNLRPGARPCGSYHEAYASVHGMHSQR